MTTVLYNSHARLAQAALRASDRLLVERQERLSTGLKVATAKDNAAYWSVGAAIYSDMAAQKAIRDGMSLSLGVVDTAMNAAAPILKGVERLKAIFTMGRQATPEEALVYDREIRQIAAGMEATIKAASFGGVNLLYHVSGTSYTRTFNAGLSRSSDGTIVMNRMSLDLNKTTMIDEEKTGGVLSMTYYDQYNFTTGRRIFSGYGGNSWLLAFYNSSNGAMFNTGGRKANLDIIEQIGSAVREGFATLGAFQKRLETQRDLLERLTLTHTRGLSRLIDADMNQESALLRAEQTRRQLAVQSLSIANSTPSRLLGQLFR
ncbi:flagellin N-terminal helical domain-containing protein [Gellertiella hungarica]|uniref:Flagellin n=1 Tax=Gellertiella hungarica TaxID=1572859 RepID=A0A7W6J1Q2_9HYPH|nr:flagellin [Gellertiella hungarica]MBB4063148.1 flagellin [Gellertiella hungarica]